MLSQKKITELLSNKKISIPFLISGFLFSYYGHLLLQKIGIHSWSFIGSIFFAIALGFSGYIASKDNTKVFAFIFVAIIGLSVYNFVSFQENWFNEITSNSGETYADILETYTSASMNDNGQSHYDFILKYSYEVEGSTYYGALDHQGFYNAYEEGESLSIIYNKDQPYFEAVVFEPDGSIFLGLNYWVQ